MAIKFPFVSAFLCERVLQEHDNIISAIRIVDIFQVPKKLAEHTAVSFYAVVSLRTVPVPDEQVRVKIAMVQVSGDREYLPDPPGQPYDLRKLTPDPSLPGGVSLIVQLNLRPAHEGLCFLEIEIDGEIAVRIPFTIRYIQEEQAH